MKTKQEIVENWLPRYTGLSLEKFGKYLVVSHHESFLSRI